jgi:hypothetical protein
MVTVGVLATFEFKPGNESVAAEFFQRGLQIVDDQPTSTVWFAFRLSPTKYGAFAAFEGNDDRAALLAAGGPKLSQDNVDLFETPPTFELVDVLAARRPGMATPPPPA